MKTQKKFKYCNYWQTWSRVLQWQGENQYQVEVDLTPINSYWAINWDQIKRISIRRHLTAPSKNDKSTNELPLEVLKKMVDMLGEDLVDRLLNEDFLSQIDWDKYEKVFNGGAGLNAIKVN